MKVNVSEATNQQLDYLVATALGIPIIQVTAGVTYTPDYPKLGGAPFHPTTNPLQGHPILEREAIQTWKEERDGPWFASAFGDTSLDRAGAPYPSGPTMLIAGLRCFVASELGEEVEIPEELA